MTTDLLQKFYRGFLFMYFVTGLDVFSHLSEINGLATAEDLCTLMHSYLVYIVCDTFIIL